jgi:chloride channel 2
MVWYGKVWYGMAWYGMVWCGVVWCGVVWCGVVWYGMVWYGISDWFKFSVIFMYVNRTRRIPCFQVLLIMLQFFS